ncbi:MAG TPA: hypothetical protein VEA69_24385 [Tepidisphaeraceae bacterium]|nr:hypothetical protein [Tepidisphaeraceae bacterium]
MRHRRFPVFPTSAFALTVLLATLGARGDVPTNPAELKVAIEGHKLVINGKTIAVPCERAELEAALGKPDRESDLANLILTWDHFGVIAYVRKDKGVVRQVTVVLDKDAPKFWPAKTFTGTLTLDGAPVTAKSTAEEINAAKTGEKLRADKTMATWQVINYPDAIVTVQSPGEKGSKDAKVGSVTVDTRYVKPKAAGK